MLEEVPRIRSREIGHSEEVFSLFAIPKELQGKRGKETWRIGSQVGCLGEAEENSL